MANDLTTFPVTTVKVTEMPTAPVEVGDILMTVDATDGKSKQTTVGDIIALVPGGTADGAISDVALTGDDIAFTGTGGGFNGSVDISAADSVVANTAGVAQNATDIAQNTTSIAQNTSDIASNATNIATNTASITTNTADIAQNTTDITSNTTSITQNTTNIAQNTTDIDGVKAITDLITVTGPINLDVVGATSGLTSIALKPHIGNSTLEYSMYSNNLAIRTGHGSASTLFIRANGKQRQIDVPTEFPNGRAGDNITGVSVLGNTVWVFIYNSVITRSNRLYKITGSELDVDTVVITEIDTTTNGVLVPNNSTAQSVQFVVDENETFYVNRDGGVTAGSPSLIRKFTVNASNVAIDGGNVTLAGTLVTVPSSFVVRGNGDFIATDINENFEIFDSAGISTFSESNYVNNGESNILLAKEGNNEVLFFYRTNTASSEVATAVPLF